MDASSLFMDEQRRSDVRRKGLNGIDDVELGGDARTLKVRLFRALGEDIGPANVRIEGGERIRDITICVFSPGSSGGSCSTGIRVSPRTTISRSLA